MPREAKTEEVLAQEVGLSESLQTPEKPVVDIKIVYLGSNPRHAVSHKGRMIVEPRLGRDPLRTPTGAGREHYDFTRLDENGDPVPTNAFRGLMPSNHPIKEVANRPFCLCSHIEHVYLFSQAKSAEGHPLYKLVGLPSDMQVAENYIQRRLRAKRSTDRFTEAVSQ